jgi:plasmid stabilization system protein ParE
MAPFEFEIRQLLYGNYRLLFTVRDDAVVILHVRHGAREWMKPEDVVPAAGP